jgi:polysaccharide pyruvyl transferase WcaK-like protein
LIVNWSGLNTGDDVMLETVAHQARAKWPGLELGVVGHHVSAQIAERLRLRVFGAVFAVEQGLGAWRDLRQAVQWADAVLVGGGDIMRERTASLLPFALAAALGRPVAGVSLGVVGRSASRFWRRAYALCIGAAQLLYVRDQKSLSLLAPDAAAEGKFRVAPDVAFVSHRHHAAAPAKPAGAPLQVCVNLRELSDTAYLGVMSDGVNAQVARICQSLVAPGSPAIGEVVLVPMVDESAVGVTADQRDSDGHILRALAQALGAHGVATRVIDTRPSGFDDLAQWLDHADLVIGARYHFLIAALVSNATLYSVSYAEKVTQLRLAIPDMRELADGALSQSSPQQIADRHRRVAEMAARAQAALDDVLAVLDERAARTLAHRACGVALVALLALEPATRGARVRVGKLLRVLRGTAVARHGGRG